MIAQRRCVQSIKTMGVLVDRRRERTAAGALMEMSTLANEKHRLQQEEARWGHRHGEIKARLREIAQKETRLMKFVKDPEAPSAMPLAVSEPPKRMRVRELKY